jgi:RNA polymerase sigma-70 factor (ECF subfamily)
MPSSADDAARSSSDDKTLLTRIAAGEEDALRQLYAAYRPRLWRFVLQQLNGNIELTNTVLQDVFLGVWRAAASYRGEATVATWLFCISRNVVSNARQSRYGAMYHHEISQERAGDGEALGTVHSPEQAVVDRMTLREAFGHLSSKYREVVDLVFVYGFTYEETARILDIPAGTVKSRLNAARKLLIEFLAEHDEIPS